MLRETGGCPWFISEQHSQRSSIGHENHVIEVNTQVGNWMPRTSITEETSKPRYCFCKVSAGSLMCMRCGRKKVILTAPSILYDKNIILTINLSNQDRTWHIKKWYLNYRRVDDGGEYSPQVVHMYVIGFDLCFPIIKHARSHIRK